ncbi:MAG TPA: histone deacetylase [Methanospirillum sp.]|uniref:histone deacetylase family protein n=1 Tax=Methanospirillum sp. TaxID=45200 RepID=UPI002C988531|nr:histone deacetylase [Methanospirillum sp.]HOJ96967.1 histone deacetylase [Methanospirillum sp.]HPP78250.1 histone deacetylase [Methanospirillum sp.]
MTPVIYTPRFLNHISSPETAERAEQSYEYLKSHSVSEFVEPKQFDEKYIKAVHSSSYIRQLKMDAEYKTDLYQNACISAFGCLTAGELVSQEQTKTAMVLNRPPGHHTYKDYGGGFCYLNNVAILARYLQKHGMEKIMILDWDAHHGNGTESIFYDDPSVLFCSIHQSPLYPGTGKLMDTGVDEGLGYTINLPVVPETGHDTYIKLFKEIIVPVGKEFNPDIVLISSGLDSHYNDPLTDLTLSDRSYYDMTRCVKRLISDKIITVLEGGYNIENVKRSNHEIYLALSGKPSESEAIQYIPETDTMKYMVKQYKESIAGFWNI